MRDEDEGEGLRSSATFSRRAVLRAGVLGAAAVAAGAAVAPVQAEADVTQDQPLGTGTYALDQDWLFGGVYATGSEAPGYSESGFAAITLPHTVVPLSWGNWDHTSWEQVWIYRKHFSGAAVSGGRVFVDFQGVMTNATVFLNGTQLGIHQGGYLPFCVELTEHIVAGDNVLAVQVDGTVENVPPNNAAAGAGAVDYLQPAGIYRDAALRIVPEVFVSDVFAKPTNVLTAPGLDALVTLDAGAVPSGPVTIAVALSDASATVGSAAAQVTVAQTGPTQHTVSVGPVSGIGLWSPDSPTLYTVSVTVTAPGGAAHTFTTRTGFRTAEFRVDGFYLNGARLQVFGLNRHQLFPYTGMAAPARLQRRDAEILRDDLNCNMVRCSHYPQSEWFLDACDELGLMVWEEPPGWGYVGQDEQFQALVVQNMQDLVLRDRSRPSVIVWATRLNETTTESSRSTGPANEALYRQTGQVVADEDGTRQSTGAMNDYSLSGWDQQVFAYDDYNNVNNQDARLNPPITDANGNQPPYLVSESVGALDGSPTYRWIDPASTLSLQAKLHAEVHSQAGAPGYAGLLGWAGIDYASINGANINMVAVLTGAASRIWDNLKTCGVLDPFRARKPGATVYQAQTPSGAAPVVLPALFWDAGSTPMSQAIVFTNCPGLKVSVGGSTLSASSQAAAFPHLANAPWYVNLPAVPGGDPDLLIQGLDGQGNPAGAPVQMSADTTQDRVALAVGDGAIDGDGSDATRFTFRVVDRYGNQRHGATGTAAVALSGPATLECDPTFDFGANGGVAGGFVRSQAGGSGQATVTVTVSSLPAGGRTASATVSVAPGAGPVAPVGGGGPRSLNPEPIVSPSAPPATAPPATGPPATAPPASTPPAPPGSPAAPGGAPATKRPASIRAALRRILSPQGPGSRISRLLRHGYTVTFSAPAAGRLVIGWYRVVEVRDRRPPHRRRRHQLLIAEASAHVRGPGRAKVHLRLTARGRTLLRHARHERLTAEAAFTPHGQRKVTVSRVITLRR